MKPTPDQINAALDELRKNLQNPAYWDRADAMKRGAQDMQDKAVVDRTKLHKPVTI